MIITRTSRYSGITRTRDIDITQDQYDNWLSGNGHIQNIMSNISDSDREFILSGVTEAEWDEAFSEVMENNDEDAADAQDAF
jgi:hypothetical protein